MPSAAVPTGGVEAIAHRGKQLFNSALGPEGALDNSKKPAGRLSDFGWGTCYSCHPQALTDSVTWMFPDGPRQAISMESTFPFGQAVILPNEAPDIVASHQRALNWSAIRDEVQDFTRNVRAVSGGGGLIQGIPEGAAGLANVPDLVPVANSGRSTDLDAIATYLAVGVRAPIPPVPSHQLTVRLGRLVFGVQGCQNCHSGPNWTSSAIDVTPPPANPTAQIVDNQLIDFLCRVDTFDPTLTDGVSNERSRRTRPTRRSCKPAASMGSTHRRSCRSSPAHRICTVAPPPRSTTCSTTSPTGPPGVPMGSTS
jgi:hypothetical protein